MPPRAALTLSEFSDRWDMRASITMDLYFHEFETARRPEQVTNRITAALGGLVESDKF